jgi:hypothetical protein
VEDDVELVNDPQCLVGFLLRELSLGKLFGQHRGDLVQKQ